MGSLIKSAKNSWKTTAVGVLSGLAILVNQGIAFLDSDPLTIFDLNEVLAGVGLIFMSIVARDNNVTSEEAQK